MDIRSELLEIVKQYVDCGNQEIDTSMNLKCIGLNSFVVMSLVSEIEDHFNISIPDMELMNFTCLDDFTRFIETNKN